MIGKILFALCALATLSHVCPSALTKDVTKSARPQLKDVLVQIKNTDIPRQIVQVAFKNPEETVSALADLISSKGTPEVSEILDVFNTGLGSKLLVVNGDNIQVDPVAYEALLSEKARSAVKSLFPKDYVRQISTFAFLQKQIQQVSQEVRPIIDDRKISVKSVTALLTPDQRISKRGLLPDLVNELGSLICNTLLGGIFSALTPLIQTLEALLNSVSLGSDGGIIGSLVEFVIGFVLGIVDSLLGTVVTLADSITSSICDAILAPSNSTSSRKRRDVAEALNRDVLSDVGSIVWTVLSTIWNLLKTLVVDTLSILLSGLFSIITTVLTNLLFDLLGYIFGIIGAIFAI